MKRVLIVDDSNFMRMAIRKILVKNNFKVIGEATNGKEGVEKYKELWPDIVTMDITMDEMTGLEALREIIKVNQDAKVVMVTAMGQKDFIMEAITSGAKGFLLKPYVENRVIETLSKL